MVHSLGFASNLSWNAPSWSISVELFVNLVLGLALIAAKGNARRLVWLAAVTIASVGYFALYREIGQLGAITERVYGSINASVVRGFAGIALGVVCFGVYEKLQHLRPRGWQRVLSALMALKLAGLCLYLLNEDAGFKHSDFALLPLFFLTIFWIAIAERWNPITRGASLLYALDGASYAVYLLHWPVITFLRYQAIHAWRWPINFADPLTTALILGGILIGAIAVFFLIELPLKSYTKRWLTLQRVESLPAL